MTDRVTTARVLVDGMTCGSCEQRIEQAVSALEGVRRVGASASLSEVMVYYEPGRVGLAAIHDAIRAAGYTVRDEGADPAPTSAGRGAAGAPLYRFLGLLALIAAVFLIIRYSVGFTFLPAVSQSMGYGLIFVVGLLTSLHCIAMCGGIVLSQGLKQKDAEPQVAAGSRLARTTAGLRPSLLYNAGRVVSYTVIGGAVGALGSLFSLSTTLKGVMPIVAGAFMLFLGVRMLGVFPWLSRLKIRFPGLGAAQARAAASRRGPFVIGLLNGLMPCGPLQTMQVYALGTGSFFAGAFSMFLFSLGTVPLLLGFGALSALLSAKFNRRMLKASGVLVMVLGLVMGTRGLSLFGVALPRMGPAGAQVQAAGPGAGVARLPAGAAVSRLGDGIQEVTTRVLADAYQPFVVQAGIPVRWTIEVEAEDLNGCNNALVVPAYGIRKKLVAGQNVVEFTPTRAGTLSYTCWMGMITSTIEVVTELSASGAGARTTPAAAIPDEAGVSGGCCGQ